MKAANCSTDKDGSGFCVYEAEGDQDGSSEQFIRWDEWGRNGPEEGWGRSPALAK
jgi:hypothetical protein